MNLTKRQEIQLNKVFDNPKKLRKWVDDVYNDMINQCEKHTKKMINEYLDIYSIAVAYTLRFWKKRLPEVMTRIWNNVDALKEEYISYEDCIKDLKDNGIEFENIVNKENKIKWKEQ